MGKNDIQLLVNQLNRASDAYYNGTEIMSDTEYDTLYSQLVVAEKETGIVLSNSPTRNVGAKVKNELPKIKHAQPMLSLEKITTIQKIKDFSKNSKCLMSLKMDGISCRCAYDTHGDLIMLATRGDGEIGTNIMSNLFCFSNIPHHIETDGQEFVIDGEAICTFDNFNRLNEDANIPFKHPRAVASGTVSLLDHAEAARRNLTFVAWKFVRGSKSMDHGETLDELKTLGFEVVPWAYFEQDNIENNINMLLKQAKEKSYPYDGIVISIVDKNIWNSLGATSHHPKHSCAYKFDQEAEETTITGFEFSCGKTGQLTPVAIFHAVTLDGANVNRASCHNISYCKNLNLGVGARVKVIKAMQIIPQIIECVELGEPFTPITICPICGAPTEIVKDNESEVLKCTNSDCVGKKLGQFVHFCSKKAMNIDGLSEATLETLLSHGYIHDFRSIYHLSDYYNELVKLDGFGSKSVKKLLQSIENSRNVDLAHFICALSIPQIGSTASKIISDYCDGDFYKFVDATLGKDKNGEHGFLWTSLPTFGEVMGNNIDNWIENYCDDMGLLAQEMHFTKEGKKVVAENPFMNKTICVTGKLTSFTRDSINEKIASLGAKATSSISKNCNYLIANEASGSSKYKKAIELGIPIIDEATFINMIGE